MNIKKIMPSILLRDGVAIAEDSQTPFEGFATAAELASYYANNGADSLLVLDKTSSGDAQHDKNIGIMKEIVSASDVPVYAGGIVKRFEDIKKYLYTGAQKVLVCINQDVELTALKEGCARFGKDKLIACMEDTRLLESHKELIEESVFAVLVFGADDEKSKQFSSKIKLPLILSAKAQKAAALMELIRPETVMGLSGVWSQNTDTNLVAFRYACKADGIPVAFDKSKIAWSGLKLNSDGMIPVIVQDYKTDEVLMLAYMNEEAFEETIASGKMTYWSRSRNELWKKGLTSGHYQYLKKLTADCDKDTLLARVSQVGAACHTGKPSCFFNEMLKKDYDDTNPLRVFEDVYGVIKDRKEHPKEGSYTNYLFDKGIDKILKKVGEEATEIVIAAKNPDPEEIKYEVSDFLYHVMVLMVERGVTWEDITRELAHR